MPHSARTVGMACCLLVAVLCLTSCASKSLVRRQYDQKTYDYAHTLRDSIPKDSVEFVAFGDTQTGWRAEHRFYRSENWYTWKHALFPFYQFYLLGNAVFGAIDYYRSVPDYGTWSRRFMSGAIAEEAKDVNADFMLFLGDATDDGRRADHWGYFMNDYGQLLKRYPFASVPGNHTFSLDSLGWDNYQAVFGKPHFYTLDTPQATFFMLDSNYIIDQPGAQDRDLQDRRWEKWYVSADSSTNRSWLERQLEKRKDRPYKIVALHHPLVTFGRHLEDWYEPEHGRNLLEKRTQLLKLLQKYKVQVIFSGHEHVYEHNTLRYKWGDFDANRIHQVITSGGGTPPREIATPQEMDRRRALYKKQGMDVKPLKQESLYHYTTVRIRPQGLQIQTYAVGDYAPHSARLIDQIHIERPEWASPPAASSRAVETVSSGTDQNE